MRFNPVVQRARSQAVRLFNGLIDPGRLYIGSEPMQAVQLCNRLAGYTSGRSPGCPVAQTDKLILTSTSGGVQGVQLCNGLAGYILGQSLGRPVAQRAN